MTSRNPRETVFRKVLVYPANEDKPRLILKEFSEEGANHPHRFYTTDLDLRSSYGKYINDIRPTPLDVTDQSDKLLDGQYCVYYNINVRLPLNRCAAHVVGVDPKHPGPKPFYRGDLFVAKLQKWPGPIIRGGGNHIDWLDCPPGTEAIVERFLKYKSEKLETLIEDEKELYDEMSKTQNHPLIQAIEASRKERGFRTRTYPYKDRTERTIAEMEKYRDKQIVREENRNCTTCGLTGQSDLKVCSGCKRAKYCSRECQKADWKNHKKECIGRE